MMILLGVCDTMSELNVCDHSHLTIVQPQISNNYLL
jgi:hypothetical protein